jgi:carbamoyltransferase
MFQNVFVQPAAGDDGTALGAALYVARCYDSDCKPYRMTGPFWGPEYAREEIETALCSRNDCNAVFVEDFSAVCMETAARLARGQIVGWFQGRMEYGPRALGGRSILADPRDPQMRNRINALIKMREGFRPFAPVVKSEAAARYFEMTEGEEEAYAHMLFVAQVRPAFREKLPAVTHVDGSARVQTVSREHHAKLWELLSKFEEETEFPVLLNTSFNVNGQPIVCTPDEALNTFLQAGLDLLVMDNFMIYPELRR